MSDKVVFYKELKARKAKAIADEIKVMENKIDFYRQIISKTLTINDEKNVNFPGSCRVSKRNTKGKWTVTDEDSLAELMKKEKKFDEVFEKVTTIVLDKKNLNAILDNWKKRNR